MRQRKIQIPREEGNTAELLFQDLCHHYKRNVVTLAAFQCIDRVGTDESDCR